MTDLFDSDIGHQPKPLLDPQHGFLDFWASYPSGSRRVAKPQCLQKWIKLGCAKNSLHIISHVNHMKLYDAGWIQGFHPMVLTYLNQQRWIDWESVPKPKPKTFLEDYDEHCKKAVPMPAHLKRTPA